MATGEQELTLQQYYAAVQQAAAQGKRIVIYGAGRVGCGLLAALEQRGIAVDCFLVTDASVNKREESGLPVVGIEAFSQRPEDVLVLIAIKRPWNKEIRETLEARHYEYLDVITALEHFVEKPVLFEINAVVGCCVACKYCPQDVLLKAYHGERFLTFEHFKQVLAKIPEGMIIGFSGFSEPFQNPEMVDMIRYAHAQGRQIMLCTTLVGLTMEKFEQIKDIPFHTVTLHVPDKHENAIIPMTEEYFRVLDAVLDWKMVRDGRETTVVGKANCQGEVHPKIREFIRGRVLIFPELADRAGNLKDEGLYSVGTLDGPIYCNYSPELNNNLLMPNGDVVLCCMDFGLRHVLGNLFTQSFEDIRGSKELAHVRRALVQSGGGRRPLQALHRGEILRRIRRDTMKYLLFGAGRIGRRLLRLIGADRVVAFIDNKKAGQQLEGKDILSLDQAVGQHPEVPILLSIKDRTLSTEVERQLEGRGLPFLPFDAFFLGYLRDCQRDHTAYYEMYRDEIDYMVSRQRLAMLPAPFYDAYVDRAFSYQEEGDGLVSFLRNGKKIYLPKQLHTDIQGYIRSLFAEQDPASPHQYFDEDHCVSSEEIFVDVGGAEALSSIDVLDVAKHIVIFEGDPIWQKPLAKTFAPYRDRVTIVPKYVGSIDDAQTVRIDTYFRDIHESIFFKVDIEGAEREFLRGAEKTLGRDAIKISICTYHNVEDAADFLKFFQSHGYDCDFSKGRIFANAEFVKGVLWGERKDRLVQG